MLIEYNFRRHLVSKCEIVRINSYHNKNLFVEGIIRDDAPLKMRELFIEDLKSQLKELLKSRS